MKYKLKSSVPHPCIIYLSEIINAEIDDEKVQYNDNNNKQ